MVCGCSRDRKMNERSSAIGHRRTSWASSSMISRRISSRSAAASGWKRFSAERARVPRAGPCVPRRGPASRWLDATGYGGTGPAGRLPGHQPGEVAERLGRVAVVGQPGPLDQVARVQVLGHRGPAEEAGADRHRRGQVGLEARAAQAAAHVDGDPQHLDGRAVLHDHARVGAVDGGRVAAAGQPQHGPGGVDAAPRRRHPDQAEHRAQLLVGQRLLRARPGRTAPAAPGCCAGTRMPASAAIQAASRPTKRMSNRPPGNSSAEILSRSLRVEQVRRRPA